MPYLPGRSYQGYTNSYISYWLSFYSIYHTSIFRPQLKPFTYYAILHMYLVYFVKTLTSFKYLYNFSETEHLNFEQRWKHQEKTILSQKDIFKNYATLYLNILRVLSYCQKVLFRQSSMIFYQVRLAKLGMFTRNLLWNI